MSWGCCSISHTWLPSVAGKQAGKPAPGTSRRRQDTRLLVAQPPPNRCALDQRCQRRPHDGGVLPDQGSHSASRFRSSHSNRRGSTCFCVRRPPMSSGVREYARPIAGARARRPRPRHARRQGGRRRTRDGGASWQDMRKGLPQENAHLGVLRQGMTIDKHDVPGVYFGTSTVRCSRAPTRARRGARSSATCRRSPPSMWWCSTEVADLRLPGPSLRSSPG